MKERMEATLSSEPFLTVCLWWWGVVVVVEVSPCCTLLYPSLPTSSSSSSSSCEVYAAFNDLKFIMFSNSNKKKKL